MAAASVPQLSLLAPDAVLAADRVWVRLSRPQPLAEVRRRLWMPEPTDRRAYLPRHSSPQSPEPPPPIRCLDAAGPPGLPLRRSRAWGAYRLQLAGRKCPARWPRPGV